MYTEKPKTGNLVSDQPDNPSLLPVVFEGDSLDVLRGFPAGPRQDLGYALYQLQLGQTPADSKRAPGIGAGVFELREQDQRAWYRILFNRHGGQIHVLHCFEKDTNRIEQHDINTAKTRLQRVLRGEKTEHAKQTRRTGRKGKHSR